MCAKDNPSLCSLNPCVLKTNKLKNLILSIKQNKLKQIGGGWMDGRMYECMGAGGLVDGWIMEWIHGWVSGLVGGWSVGGLMDIHFFVHMSMSTPGNC